MQSLVDWLIGWRKASCFHLILHFFFSRHCYRLLDFNYLIIYLFFSGVYDALQKKYLKTLLFCICESIDGAMIEEYSCNVSESSFYSYFQSFSGSILDLTNWCAFSMQFLLVIPILIAKRFQWILIALETRSKEGNSSVTLPLKLLPIKWGDINSILKAV